MFLAITLADFLSEGAWNKDGLFLGLLCGLNSFSDYKSDFVYKIIL